LLITIKNRKDVFNYRLSDFIAEGCNSSNIESINHEYLINAQAITTIKFYEDFESQYAMGDDVLSKCIKTIVFSVGSDYEVLAFEESAVGEFHRIKRELGELFSVKKKNDEELNENEQLKVVAK
jgi:hypothetical protein